MQKQDVEETFTNGATILHFMIPWYVHILTIIQTIQWLYSHLYQWMRKVAWKNSAFDSVRVIYSVLMGVCGSWCMGTIQLRMIYGNVKVAPSWDACTMWSFASKRERCGRTNLGTGLATQTGSCRRVVQVTCFVRNEKLSLIRITKLNCPHSCRHRKELLA